MVTLRTGINVWSGINLLVGKFSKNDKHMVWNNHTGGKILQHVHRKFGIKAKNTCAFTAIFVVKLLMYRTSVHAINLDCFYVYFSILYQRINQYDAYQMTLNSTLLCT